MPLAKPALAAMALDGEPFRIVVSGCVLPEGRSVEPPPPALSPQKQTIDRTKAPAGRTRVRPPADIVRLIDRLEFLLQPPLESLIAQQELTFPHEPFGYQLEGVAFLLSRRHAVLADEMGLGKTMQTITAIRLLARAGKVRSVLLVCPKPLVANWQREFSQWAPELPLAVIDGRQAVRAWAWREATPAVRITNYETLVRDMPLVCGAGPFDLVVVDEAQRIKNPTSATSQAVRSLPRNSSWALTGTPVENCTDDLVSILEFAAPGATAPGATPRSLRPLVRDLVLRRRKEQVLSELPPMTVTDQRIDLTPEQRRAYARAEDDGVVQLNALGPEVDIRHVFQLVLRLKQLCNFDPISGASAKLERLEAELDECNASGRKAIVFSQWVETIGRLSQRLARFGPAEYHGRVPGPRREEAIARFRDDPACGVLLMSYGAGSVGLNLQFAQYVFLFDRWWNPAVEDQAINRAHRIGAAAPVTVVRYMSAETIEERIDLVLAEKRKLAESVLGEGTAPGRGGLTRDDLLGLFQRPLQDPPIAHGQTLRVA